MSASCRCAHPLEIPHRRVPERSPGRVADSRRSRCRTRRRPWSAWRHGRCCLAAAVAESRIVVSADTDFGDLLAERRLAVPSVVLFRRHGRTAERQVSILLANLDQVASDLIEARWSLLPVIDFGCAGFLSVDIATPGIDGWSLPIGVGGRPTTTFDLEVLPNRDQLPASRFNARLALVTRRRRTSPWRVSAAGCPSVRSGGPAVIVSRSRAVAVIASLFRLGVAGRRWSWPLGHGRAASGRVRGKFFRVLPPPAAAVHPVAARRRVTRLRSGWMSRPAKTRG